MKVGYDGLYLYICDSHMCDDDGIDDDTHRDKRI